MKLSLQRLRFGIWGETLGLVSGQSQEQRQYARWLDRPDVRSAIISSLNQMQNLLTKADVVTVRYALKNERKPVQELELVGASRGITTFRESFEKFREKVKRNQKQKSIWIITKWSVHDHAKFKQLVENITQVIDGLESITTPLGILAQQWTRLEEEIDSLSDAESLRLLQEIGSSDRAPGVLRAISETASARLTFVTSSSRSYHTAQTKQSHPSAQNPTSTAGPTSVAGPTSAAGPISTAGPTSTARPTSTAGPSTSTIFVFRNGHENSVDIQGNQRPEIAESPDRSLVQVQTLGAAQQSVDDDLAEIPQQQRWIAALVARVPQREAKPVFSAEDREYGNILNQVKRDDDALCTPRLAELSSQASNGSSLAQRMFIELRNIRRAAVPYVSAAPVRDSLDKILASIEGPPGTPYEGGVFWITVRFAEGKPPALRFQTRVYHPNIDPSGKLCADYQAWWRDTRLLNGIQRLPKHSVISWFSSHGTNHYTLGALLVAICALLASPNIHDPLVPEIAEKYLTDFDGYCAAAKHYTNMYAHSNRPHEDDLKFATINHEDGSRVYHVPDFEQRQHTESQIARYNSQDGSSIISGETALLLAAKDGNEEDVIRILCTTKVAIDFKGPRDGRTPLSWAAENGLESAIQVLLNTRKVEVDSKDFSGRTPLLLAAKNGHKGIIKLLLDTGEVEVDQKSNYGQTPLSWAAENGHEAAVKLFLETGKVEVNSKDFNDWTPLSWAAKNGHILVVKLLLDTGKADIDSPDFSGQTPLLWAARNGHTDITELFLGTGKADIDVKDFGGRTPLCWAAMSGHKAIVKLLLETGKVEVDSKDINGWTPLSWAVENGHKDIIKLLLDTGKIGVDSQDPIGRTPLWLATKNGDKTIDDMFLKAGHENC